MTMTVAAPRAVVFDTFADREQYGRFLPLQVRLHHAGLNERQGIGAVHTLGLGPVAVRERIIAIEPLKRIAYELIAGAPVRSHTGEITFADHLGGTRVIYRMDSVPSVPVPRRLLALGLKAAIWVMVRGAARTAERRSSQA